MSDAAGFEKDGVEKVVIGLEVSVSHMVLGFGG